MNKFNFYALVVFSLVLAISASAFIFRTIKADSNTVATNQETKEIAKIDTSEIKPLPKTIPDMPILMYHHIREYSDSSDQTGINLSVSPTKLAEQLDLIKSSGYTTITFNDLNEGNIPSKPIILTFDDGYENFYQSAFPALKSREMKAVSYIITNDTGGQYMTTDQVKEISENGIEIGSHTLSHPDLTKLSQGKLTDETKNSKEELEKIIGKPVVSFCYPSGQYNDAVVAAVEAAGYKFAVTTKPGVSNFSSPLRLNRHRVNHDTSISGYLK